MNGVELLLRALHRGEQALAEELTAAAEHHRAEHEIHHVATDLAAWSHEHVQRLTRTAAERGLDLAGVPAGAPGNILGADPMSTPEAGGPSPESPLMLLRDLRNLHLRAVSNSLHWEMLAQAAQASKDAALLSLASDCHPRTLRQMRWTNTLLKTLSAQAITSM
ncbi:hypothetical protein [Streptomyces sp. NPDC051921]|uniref:hypothetical protein n=1 Tax=Streptomyces sp. NPDC051921 TaxID=3155806 RepID=UPI0034468B5C